MSSWIKCSGIGHCPTRTSRSLGASKCQALGTAQSHFGSQWLKKTLSDFETNSVDISLPDVSDLRMRDVLVSIHEEMQKVKSGLPEVHLDVPRWNLDGALQGVDDLTKRMNADVSIDASAFSSLLYSLQSQETLDPHWGSMLLKSALIPFYNEIVVFISGFFKVLLP
ncbi:hypothetical protein M9435_005496 [Picochlorum sp. BPE23]|nr:hypothetical protein M9435_005496 [Picochlorum sp. BPE23]